MKYFRLHGNCFIVKGATQALVYDLFKSRTLGISLNFSMLYESQFLIDPYDDVLESNKEWKEPIIKIINYLIDNDFAFFTDEPENFPQLDIKFNIVKRIYSAIIELDTKSLQQYEALIENLLSLDCQFFCLVVTEDVYDHKEFEKLLGIFKESRAKWVRVIMKRPYLNFKELQQVTHDMRIVYKIYNAPKDKTIKDRWWLEESPHKFDIVEYISDPFDLHIKSKYGIEHFYPTQDVFLESQNHNSFFNLKVCIDKAGYFKNDLAFDESFGNFKTRSLHDLLTDESFKKLWYIPNDKIEKCKDCQYRYQCISNSNIKEIEGKYFKIDSCNFDPYQNVWI